MIADATAMLVAGFTATWMRFGSIAANVAFENTTLTIPFWQVAVVIVPVWMVLMWAAKLYDLDTVTWGLSSAGRIARTLSLGIVALILATYLVKLPGLSRAWTVLFWALAIAFVLVARGLVSLTITFAHHYGYLVQPTLVVGANAEAADILRVLQADKDAGLVPIGCVASSQAERLELDFCSGDLPVLGAAREIVEVIGDSGADTVVIASSAFDHDVLARMIAELRTVDVDVHISSGLFEVLTSRVMVTEIAGVPLITVKGLPLTKANIATKRVFDLFLSVLGVTVFAPLWLLIALLIKLGSPGPVFYTQKRIGRNGAEFEMFKFRSMYRDADERLAEVLKTNEASGPLFKMKDDPRVTPIGRWLRKFSVDEIPQVINVLKGEMSLVGPRPPLPREVDEYSTNHWRRLSVVPGMTGLWQVSGRSSLTFDEMVRLDLFYIENWSVGLDISLLVRTVPAVLFTKGAY
jgi:exopolysaccharide biosynthesis polyprenyl glycosylphosphotransferase